MQIKTFPAGEVIFTEGEDSSEAYRLLTGEIEISITTSEGPRTVATLEPGVFFGEMSLIDDKPRSATAKALTDCKTEVFNEENFTERVLGDEGNLYLYLSTLFERIRDTDALLQMQFNKERPMVGSVSRSSSSVPASPGSGVTRKALLVSLYDKTSWKGASIKVEIARFPFRIGRASESAGRTPLTSNDLTIPDDKPYQISRNHCIIEQSGDGLILRDRGSTVGTIVNGVAIGTAHEALSAELKLGENLVTFGAVESQHQFQLIVT
jgi:hypothetical protein